MSTRSYIAIQKPEASHLPGDLYEAVYCHFDGYPEHVGAILENNYTTRDKVQQLISRGDMSWLRETLETSNFYYEQRNPRVKTYSSTTLLKQSAKACWAKYLYLFTLDNKWKRFDI